MRGQGQKNTPSTLPRVSRCTSAPFSFKSLTCRAGADRTITTADTSCSVPRDVPLGPREQDLDFIIHSQLRSQHSLLGLLVFLSFFIPIRNLSRPHAQKYSHGQAWCTAIYVARQNKLFKFISRADQDALDGEKKSSNKTRRRNFVSDGEQQVSNPAIMPCRSNGPLVSIFFYTLPKVTSKWSYNETWKKKKNSQP